MTLHQRIHMLRLEAAEAGDTEQIALCNRALEGDEEALSHLLYATPEQYEAALKAARAMFEPGPFIDIMRRQMEQKSPLTYILGVEEE